MNSGAEAVENAVKIARKYTGRKAVISFERGFHGRTLLAMSLTSKVKPYKFGFGPFAPDTYKMAYPYYFRSPYGMAPEQTDREILRRLEDFFLAEVPAEEVAAIIMEPVQGEGGFIVPSKTFVQGIRQICDKYGIFRLKRQSIWSMIRGSVCRRGFTRKMSTRRFLRRRNFMSAA